MHKVDNQPLAALGISRLVIVSDASISRKSRSVTIRQYVVYPWECWSVFLMAGCPSSYQPAGIREETLESEKFFSGS